ncbi:HipA N-terminal domain-containing protein [Tatumella citrea]|uniref:HipA N-terminal subdomain 1 domain-containing protein n=1 Tax=Tatumella citrea TaxID=53336 RepID=A0A1Y0L4Z7_TATCI|nr:HipA N-terminal domain-containing protein [Tatumella citrea]ARU92748.1 hypothetical protein A7K98_02420 [Tatumella citrea]ARU96786.1 hypothetical protein A7K99_02420 [Tatumella citrea]
MYRNLSVLLYGEPVGELLQTDEGYTFSYLPDYQGHPLSLSLPVTSQPDFSVQLHPFFKGLAPVWAHPFCNGRPQPARGTDLYHKAL